ncbi:RNA polymerase sigma-70 factor [Actinoallomurus purpureus]|uniref:RNA polymerase sigma-70 factor n=1 Tax=Actinoallomurus purpureus TaxID=478114 RepID=UPI00209239F6|nr:RNA polymerase sigma-70 factor [Actinoallomurus purpureus]MCO6006913.1 RNA polymerase sigma-70 factor [Actinoallomurus purpureus]
MRAEHPEKDSSLDQATSTFLELRPRLFGIAYRMLGSVAEAEDILQEVWLRWQKTDRTVVIAPAAFLAQTTTRLAINVAQSAKARRETYIGPWLPEPLDTSADPAAGAERAEAVELAVLLLLEKLNPTERAAYILREAFDYPYAQIADILQLSTVNTRQIVSRARKHLSTRRREPVDTAEHRRLLEVFLAAARAGDVTALEDLFAADVISYTDGNGIKGAARIPVVGPTRVAKFIAAFGPRFWPGTDVQWVETNTRPGILISRNGTHIALLTIEALPEGIHTLQWIMNPAKLEAFARSRGRTSTRDVASEGPTPPP